MIIRRDLTKTLNRFKRAYQSQIQSKLTIDENLIVKLRRHRLQTSSDQELLSLTKQLIQSINNIQQDLPTPHKGLLLFTQTLSSLTESQT